MSVVSFGNGVQLLLIFLLSFAAHPFLANAGIFGHDIMDATKAVRRPLRDVANNWLTSKLFTADS